MNDFPQPDSAWARIEAARQALGWNESDMGEKALGNRTHYTKIKTRGWSAFGKTQERIIKRLEQEGFSGSWLRAGLLPERADGAALPERPKIVTQLAQLAAKLGLSAEQITRLWVDLDAEGPLQRYPEELQRVAFAAAYLENRTLEDAQRAVEKARVSDTWANYNSNVDDMLQAVRMALRSIKRGSSGTLLLMRPPTRSK